MGWNGWNGWWSRWDGMGGMVRVRDGRVIGVEWMGVDRVVCGGGWVV